MKADKFLGFMITQRGVEANPEKCDAILQMLSPSNLKEFQRLNGKLTALSRFLGASARKALPFFKLMKKGIDFTWTEECEKAFATFKTLLSEPPILSKPIPDEPLYLYLFITDESVAAALVREDSSGSQLLIYFTSRVLHEAELRYTRIEKLAFALLITARRLRQYFQSHTIIVRTDQAIRSMLQKPDLAGRMLNWAIELSQFDIQFQLRTAIKAQAMSDFLAEMAMIGTTRENGRAWKFQVDDLSNQSSGGARIILESLEGVMTGYQFPISNNQAEYEALLAGLGLALEVGAKVLEVCTDLQVVSSQIKGTYQAKDLLLQKYLAKVKAAFHDFDKVEVAHIPRERNASADLLLKLASTKPGSGNKSLLQGIMREPSISSAEIDYF